MRSADPTWLEDDPEDSEELAAAPIPGILPNFGILFSQLFAVGRAAKDSEPTAFSNVEVTTGHK